jgi:hypothetical protein
MSYCRWSSENFTSDVYVYENIHGGWTTHVAGYRYVNFEPCPPLDPTNAGTIVKSLDAQKLWLSEAILQKINLPNAGKTFSDSTPGDCAATLENLREEGFNVPQYAIDTLMEEENGSRS